MTSKYTLTRAQAVEQVVNIERRFPGGNRRADGLSYRHDNYPGAGGVVAITASPSPRSKADGSRMWRTIDFA